MELLPQRRQLPHDRRDPGAEAVTYKRKAGDFDFIPAGPDHTLYAGVGEKVHYVWVEFNVNKRGK